MKFGGLGLVAIVGWIAISAWFWAGNQHDPASRSAPRIPGATQHRYSQHWLCEHGTRSIRPPESYTTALKNKQIRSWNLPGDQSDYEEDHLIPLSVGGSPTSSENLWPEPWSQAGSSDRIEWQVYRDACAGRLTQRAAQLKVLHWKEQHG